MWRETDSLPYRSAANLFNHLQIILQADNSHTTEQIPFIIYLNMFLGEYTWFIL